MIDRVRSVGLSWLAMSAVLLVSDGTAASQTLTIGNLPSSSNYSFSQPPNGLVSVLDLENRANFDGLLNSVTFRWSNAPCPAAVSIGTYRISLIADPHGRGPYTAAFALVGERGPFGVNSLTETVTLSPPIPVQVGDAIAIRNLTPCGSPTGLADVNAPDAFVIGSPQQYAGSAPPIGSFSSFTTVFLPIDQPVQLALQGSGTINASVIPVVISAAGQFSSVFRTSLQLYNPGSVSATGRLIFRRYDASSSLPFSAVLPYSLKEGGVLALPDLLSALGVSGLGSLDIVPDTGPKPLGIARVFNDSGSGGTAGFTENALDESTAFGAGDVTVLLAPSDPANFRFNVGIRSLSAVNLTATLRDSTGTVLTSVDRFFGPDNWFQDTASSFLYFDASIGPDSIISIEVKSGNAFIYGVAADNRTNDASFQLGQRIAP